jgi:hypothetical protein
MNDVKKIIASHSLIQEGVGIPAMQVSPQLLKKGLQAPLMQKVTSHQPKPALPQNNGTNTTPPKKSGS